MKKTLILTLVLALLATAAWAQHGPVGKGHADCAPLAGHQQQYFGPHGGQGQHQGLGMLLKFGDKIGLDDTQRDKIKALGLEHKMEMVDLHADAKKAGISLKALKHGDAPQNEVIRAMEKASRAKLEIAKAQYLHHQAIKGILTAEQQDKMKKLRQTHAQKCDGKGCRSKGGQGQCDKRGQQFGGKGCCAKHGQGQCDKRGQQFGGKGCCAKHGQAQCDKRGQDSDKGSQRQFHDRRYGR